MDLENRFSDNNGSGKSGDLPLSPLSDGGRDSQTGKFQRGNSYGKGNPQARKVQRFRSAMLAAVSVEDLKKIVQGLTEAARAGDIQAAKEILSRCCGNEQQISVEFHSAQLIEFANTWNEIAAGILVKNILKLPLTPEQKTDLLQNLADEFTAKLPSPEDF